MGKERNTDTDAGEEETCYGTMQGDESFAVYSLCLGFIGSFLLLITYYSEKLPVLPRCKVLVISFVNPLELGREGRMDTYLVCGGLSCHGRRGYKVESV